MKKSIFTMKLFMVLLGAGLLAAGCASTGQSVEPQVRILAEGEVYISPASSPGVQDSFQTGMATSSPKNTTIISYEVRVEDSDGEGVYRYRASTDESVAEEQKVAYISNIPDQIQWYGRDNKARFVDDGTYQLTVSVTNDADQTDSSEPVTVVVNNSPPEAEIEMPYNVFSPDSDGERDVLPIRQYGEDATEWIGRIVDEDDKTITAWKWDDELPEEHQWNGRNNDDEVVDDGRYQYVLRGRDKAGNRITKTQDNIRVDTEQRSLSLERNRGAFSPNDDDIRDTVTFTPKVQEDAQLMEWDFNVVDEDGDSVMERSGSDDLPDSFTFSGRSDDDMLPEGEYTPRLKVTFRNGESESAETRPVELDVTPPSVEVSLEEEEFSPEENQEITLTQDTQGGEQWKGSIIPEGEDEATLTEKWEEELPDTFSWNGQTNRGEEAGTGQYRYVLHATDRAGNRATAESEVFLLDRDAPSVRVDVEPTPFYPGADDADTELEITIETDDETDIAKQRVTVYDPEGDVFTRLGDEKEVENTLTWNGRNEDDQLPESARDYTVSVTVTDSVGNESTAERTVPIGILVEEDQEGDLRFRITGIRFAPFEADFNNLDAPDVVEENQETLDEIAALLKEYPDQNVLVEGHALHIYNEGEQMEREQEEVLLPLSEERAEVIVEALVERGVDEERLSAVGRGGSEPLFPHDDYENRWKNRRVEFELEDR